MSDFDFEDDFSGDDIDRDMKGGGSPLPEGMYCFQCTEIDPSTKETGDLKAFLEVVASTVPNTVGQTHHEYISKPSPSLSDEANGVRRSILRRFFYAMKLTSPEEIKANPKVKINLELAVGRRCCGKIVHETYESKSGDKKTKAKLFAKGGDLFATDSPKAAGIPMPAGAAGAAAPVPPQTQTPTSTTPPTSTGDAELDAMLS